MLSQVYSKWVVRNLKPIIAVCVCALALNGKNAAAAEYTLCAFRSGDNGPCTCRGPGDAPGQFSVVERRFCRSMTRAAKPARGGKIPELPEKAADIESSADANSTSENSTQVAASPSPSEPQAENPVEVSATLEKVRAAGQIRCGVNTGLLGFSARGATGLWEGIDADFCRAVAAAVLGDASKVEFIPLKTEQRFDALRQGQVDLLSRNTTWTMQRVVELGVEFVGVAYFDGQGFLTRQERGLVSAQQLDGLSVCVQSGTTTQSNLVYYLNSHGLKAEVMTFSEKPALIEAYTNSRCDAYTADRSALYSDRVGFADPQAHEILPETISKEPLGPVVKQGDRQWLEIVRWTLAGMINAEEVGLTRERAAADEDLDGDLLRLVEGAGQSGEMLGLQKSWLRNVIASVGNYGEVFEANLGEQTPVGMERGMNSLWKRGGLLYAPPMW